MSLDLIRIEESGLNVLQTQRQLFYDGWLLRLSPGSARSAPAASTRSSARRCRSSARSPIARTSTRSTALPTLFRITPLSQPADLDAALGARGYEAFGETLVQALALDHPPALPDHDDAVVVEAPDAPAFVEAVGELRDSTPAAARRASRTPRRIRCSASGMSSSARTTASSARRRSPSRTSSPACSTWSPPRTRAATRLCDARLRVAPVLGLAAWRAGVRICR